MTTRAATSTKRRPRRRRVVRQVRRRPLLTHGVAAALGAVFVLLLSWSRLGGPATEYVYRTAPGRPDPLTASPVDYRWTDPTEPDFSIPPYARFLKGVKIVLDPGHVGQFDPGGGWKRGPTGLREAEVNLRVANHLREFLQAAGADVRLTRTEDKKGRKGADDLGPRIAMANAWRADLFVSLHHNAASKSEVNYTLVFYHGDADARIGGASQRAAWCVLSGLQDALRLPVAVDGAVRADDTVHDNGFAVLRQARVPAILTEASFFTHGPEEERLRDPVYNRREAYGIFLGLARWAQAGR